MTSMGLWRRRSKIIEGASSPSTLTSEMQTEILLSRSQRPVAAGSRLPSRHTSPQIKAVTNLEVVPRFRLKISGYRANPLSLWFAISVEREEVIQKVSNSDKDRSNASHQQRRPRSHRVFPRRLARQLRALIFH